MQGRCDGAPLPRGRWAICPVLRTSGWKSWFPTRLHRALPVIDLHTNATASRIGALDGLRAVAVSAVVLYHFSPRALPSGYLGVDVFMVVSGYIVTTLMLRERERTGRIRAGAFWGRRFRRLVPALALMVIVVSALVLWTGPTTLADTARSQGLASLLYVANWNLIHAGVSYGGALVAGSPFVHLWSLAVEEQFYLVWPVVLIGLLALFRTRRWPVITVAALGAAASVAWMAYLYEPGRDPLRVYYGTDTRAYTFLIGAVAALLAPSLRARGRRVVVVHEPGRARRAPRRDVHQLPRRAVPRRVRARRARGRARDRGHDGARPAHRLARPGRRCGASGACRTACTSGTGRPSCC